jgi:hypothetical protein
VPSVVKQVSERRGYEGFKNKIEIGKVAGEPA